MKFLEAVKKYFGMPYKRACYTPKDKEYYYPMYIDCCGLTRRACIDLEAELGFQIGWWNQGYQVDTLPIILKEEELKTGDIIFYSAKLYDKDAKVHAHQMVHVEVFVGGESGKSSIGARRKNGVVQQFDNFKFESKRFFNTIFHYRSLDTWLDGICKSWCPEHEWIPAKKCTNYYASMHRKKRKEKERAQLNEIDILDYVESMDKWKNVCYININYKFKQIISSLSKLGYEEADKTDQWNYKSRLAIACNLNELDYARFKIGYHIVNRIPSLYNLTLSKNVLKMLENLKISMKLGYLDTFINLNDIIPECYILDSIPEVWRFLNCENTGVWDLVSFNFSTPGNISVVDDILKFKTKIMCLAPLEEHELIESEDSEEETGDGEASRIVFLHPKRFLMHLVLIILNQYLIQFQIQICILIYQICLENKCRSLRSIACSLPNKVIVKQSSPPSLPRITLSVHLLIASVKPYLSLIHNKKCLDDLRQFISEQDNTTQSGVSDSQHDAEGTYEEEKCNEIMMHIKEFCRLTTMEMKCHITPVFGCFEFLECSFNLDSNYQLTFRSIDSSASILNSSKPCRCPKELTALKDTSVLDSKKKPQCKKCNNKYMGNIIEEGLGIVLQLHQLEMMRVEKSNFRNMLDEVKKKSKTSGATKSFEFLYTDFE